MTEAIKKAPPTNTIKQYLEARAPNIRAVLPKQIMTVERVIKVALTAYNKTPKLRECSSESLFLAIMQAAELGLEPGGALGHAFLVPFAGECVFIPGYRGLIALARRSGEIAKIEAHLVYAGDKFAYLSHPQRLEHAPAPLGEDRGAVVGVFAVATFKDGVEQFEVMGKNDVDKVMSKSKTSGRDDSPWRQHYGEMARKTAVKRLCKYLPLTTELARAIEIDDDQEQREVIDITADPPPRARGVEGAKAALARAAPEQTAESAAAGEPPSGVILPTMAQSQANAASRKSASGKTMTITEEPGSNG